GPLRQRSLRGSLVPRLQQLQQEVRRQPRRQQSPQPGSPRLRQPPRSELTLSAVFAGLTALTTVHQSPASGAAFEVAQSGTSNTSRATISASAISGAQGAASQRTRARRALLSNAASSA